MRYLFLLLLFISFRIAAQIPAGYYDAADGQTGYTLKTSLHNIIKGHSDQGYSALWTLYETSDVRADGKVWDMYSDCDFTFGTSAEGGDQDEGSGGAIECDKFNREHSFPKSWFNDGTPMINDPFHVVPSDKKVNGIRGNYAYGEVSSPSYTSLNGSKLGPNTYPGYTGTVFEPADEYKGDLARGYFYMATRYQDVIAGWETNDSDGDGMLDGTSDHVFENWALSMLIEWHTNDPVSQKEIDRNEAIYDYQGNRNPYIDHPEYVSCIWESSCGGSTPTISLTESITDFGTVAFGNVSSTQSYTVSASNLTDDLVIAVTDSYQISLADVDADFSSSITLTPASGSVTSTTIYVRFNPIAELDGTVTGQITHNSTGASEQIIDLSGVEDAGVPAPELIITESITDFGSVTYGSVSTSQSYTISANNLTDDLLVSVSDGFQISLTDVDTDFTSELSISPSSGSVNDEIFVRFNPINNIAEAVTGTITHSSTGLSAQTIDLSGTTQLLPVIPEINFNFTQLTVRNADTQEIKLFSNAAPIEDIHVSITVSSLTNITLDDFSTTPSITNSALDLIWPAGSTSTSFDFAISNSSIFSNGLSKSVGFIINNTSDNAYTVGTNNSISINIEGDIVSGIEVLKFNQIITYPNPAEAELLVKIKSGKYDYYVMDLTGRKMLLGKVDSTSIINVNTLKSGSYILVLTDNSSSFSSVFFKK